MTLTYVGKPGGFHNPDFSRAEAVHRYMTFFQPFGIRQAVCSFSLLSTSNVLSRSSEPAPLQASIPTILGLLNNSMADIVRCERLSRGARLGRLCFEVAK